MSPVEPVEPIPQCLEDSVNTECVAIDVTSSYNTDPLRINVNHCPACGNYIAGDRMSSDLRDAAYSSLVAIFGQDVELRDVQIVD